jgi:hypothetical protein
MLPRTGFAVEVTAECAERVPGPLEEFAGELLGTRPEGPTRAWRLLSVRVTPVALPDPRGMYTVNAAGEYGGILLGLSPEGFLAGIGGAGNTARLGAGVIEYEAPVTWGAGAIDYVRFGVESTRKEVLDSNFSTIEVEGVPRRVWDPIERQVLKDRGELARDAAQGLFEIRRKRLDALTAPGGLAGESVQALEELEEEYLSLFLGKEVTREERRVFTYIPEKAGEASTLFRFSETLGFTERDNVAATPYMVEVANVAVPGEAPAETRGGVTYRVPAVGDLRVRRGETVLVEGRCIVAQLGYLQQFPLDVIGSEGLSIEFHPEYGSIKSVNKAR